MIKFTYGWTIGLLSAIVVIICPYRVVALTGPEVDAIAQEITVRIDGENDANSGSGIIMEHDGDNYLVLTNEHVVHDKGDYMVYTHDGRRYPIRASQITSFPSGLDLAVLVFNSSKSYKTAPIGNPDKLKNGMKIYVTGFCLPGPMIQEREYLSFSGEISGRSSKSDNGYELIFNVPARQGMSGGPILNEQGQVVGINGSQDRPNPNTSTLVLGIPINTYENWATATVKNLGQPNAVPPDQNFFNIGLDKYEKGDYQGANIAYTEAININHKDVKAYNNRAIIRYQLGDKQGAIADYDQAISINPNYAPAYYNRGLLHDELGDKRGAIADYDQAIKINPNFAQAYNDRGIIRNELGDKQGAIADYNQAIKISPNYAQAYYNRGIIRNESGDKQEAIDDFKQAASLYQQQGKDQDYQDALKQLNTIQESSPGQ